MIVLQGCSKTDTISSFTGMCTSPEDFCCKPKVENQPVPPPAIPETPKPTPEPSKPKCNDIPGFQCLTNINVSDHFQRMLKVSYSPHVIFFLGM